MVDEARKSSGLLQAWVAWRRRKWLALLIFTVSFSAAGSVVAFLPEIYRATATVLVERQQVAESFVRPSVTGELETRLHSVSQEILSRERLKELIARFGLYPLLTRQVSLEAATERMRRDIQLDLKGVQQTGGRSATISFALSYVGRDPQTVALVTNTLASFYVEANWRVRERQASGTAEFLKLQLATMKKRLDELEARISDFKMRYIGELPQQVPANLATLTRLNEQLRLNDANQLRARERRAALAGQVAEMDPREAAGADAVSTRLVRLNRELVELRTRFTEKHPDVIRVRTEVAELQRQLAQRPSEGRPAGEREAPTGAMKQLDGELAALKAEAESLRRDIATYQLRVESAPKREQELQQLARDYDTTKELYYSLVKRYEDAELAESMEQRQRGEHFRILDQAIAPRQPAAPNRPRFLAMSLLLSLGLAVGAVVLAERLDTSFHSADDLHGFTRVPVLATIPRIATAADARRWRLRVALGALAVALGVGLVFGAAYFVANENEDLVWMLGRGRP